MPSSSLSTELAQLVFHNVCPELHNWNREHTFFLAVAQPKHVRMGSCPWAERTEERETCHQDQGVASYIFLRTGFCVLLFEYLSVLTPSEWRTAAKVNTCFKTGPRVHNWVLKAQCTHSFQDAVCKASEFYVGNSTSMHKSRDPTSCLKPWRLLLHAPMDTLITDCNRGGRLCWLTQYLKMSQGE